MSETRAATPDPTAGMPPIAGAAAGGLNAPLSDAEQAQLARLASGEADLMPAAPPALSTAALPAGVEKLPALPKGVTQSYSFDDANKLAQYYGFLGMGENAKGWQTMADRIAGGEAPYSDGVWRPIPGGAKDPEVIARGARAQSGGGAAGTAPYDFVEVQRQGPSGTLETWRLPKDQAMSLFGAGGAPGAAPGAATPGAGPPGAPGAVGAPAGTPVIPQPVSDSFKDLREKSVAAQTGLYELGLLRDQLHALPTTGPATEMLGQMSAWAKQLGVPQETLNKYNLPTGADVATAGKLSQDLLGDVLKNQFPGRITNTDIVAWRNTVPRETTPLQANDYLIDRVLAPKFQRDIDRYNGISAMPGAYRDLQAHNQALSQWDQQNPLSSYAPTRQGPVSIAGGPPGAMAGPPAPSAGAPSLRWDPTQGKLVPMGQ
jgi:hypothetical protein